MGTDKALLDYHGKPLVAHMLDLLRQLKLQNIYISGEVPGYEFIADVARYNGPAQAIANILQDFESRHDRIIFIPVDMPLIPVEALRYLIGHTGNVYYHNYPLPACLVTGKGLTAAHSVRELLAQMQAHAIDIPPEFEKGMVNLNTQEEWIKAAT